MANEHAALESSAFLLEPVMQVSKHKIFPKVKERKKKKA